MNVFDAAALITQMLRYHYHGPFQEELIEVKHEIDTTEIRVTLETDNGPTTFTLTIH